MIFSKKTFSHILVSGILLSSAYAFVAASERVAGYSESTQLPSSTADTVKTEKAVKPTFPVKKFTQNTLDEINTKYPMDAPTPSNVKSVVEYDSKSGNYILRTMVGETEIATPFLMTEQEYRNYSAKKDLEKYWQVKNAKSDKNNEDKFSISDMKFNIGPADKVFGPGGVQIKTQGSAELIFGFKSNKIDNPALTERMRKSSNFNFDEKIQLNVTGSVGDKVNFGLNYNTESSFDFDQKMVKLAYKGKEDDIIKSIEAGNVSMQLNSSLISGGTALFGIKTEMQFGRLNVAAIATQQESQTQTVSSKGGAQTTKFEVNIDKYDENRHFFLAHYFRDNFESSMSKLPFISSGVTISRLEVWVTNKRGNYDQARNILAFMDLGETDKRDNTFWNVISSLKLPSNNVNDLYKKLNLLDGIRDVQRSNDVLASNYKQHDINGGEDYEKIESARRLEASEYTFSPTLGTISLRNALNPDEVLGVAYEYTYGGQAYQVGEFSTDAVTAPNALVVKLLKSTAQSPHLKLWDLMMKNVYDLGAMDLQKDNFKMNISYRNDSVGTDMQYITEGNIKNQLLLRVMKLDNLDSKNESNPDGKFDFVEGYTVFPSSGRIVFPVLEPFGEHLRKAIGNDAIAKKYIYTELYDSTLVVAQEYSEKNKFKLVGEYKATSGSEIRLNAMNVPRGSVTVTAGGATLVENVDYTVDYTMGTVSILNQSLIQSGTKIDVKLENQSMFSMQRKSLVGTHLEYKFNKDFSLGGTIMHLSEMPLTTKVNTGSEPISNTIWGLNTAWRAESQWLTNVLDKIPFVNATKPSTIALNAEFAQLIPGHSKVVSKDGLAYIDDFEATKTTIDIHYPINWYLAATPAGGMFPEAIKSNHVDYGKNRALLSWYYVDPLFNEDRATTPSYIKNNLDYRSNHLTRLIPQQEIFPNKQTDITKSPRMTIMNLSFFPTERGPYNLDVYPTGTSAGIDAEGKLNNPASRWGGIMRKLDATDFETSNIEYIEFWMMDPYVNKDGMDKAQQGDLYFNLGDVSEDILKDGKKSFEHGLPIDGDVTKTDTTTWGRVARIQSTVTAFSGDRKYQDVGLDGLKNDAEFTYSTYKKYLNELKAVVTNATTFKKLQDDKFSPLNDPSGDNYHFYRGADYDNLQLDVLTRYKHYNGSEGNSPDATETTESYSTTATSMPDMEDVNGDNTMNEYEKYFQYRIHINADSMAIGKNHITDIVSSNVKLANDRVDEVKWYQFKIPIREYDKDGVIGGIRNFKSIRFIRMFMTNFEKAATLRMATLDLVRGEWRSFNKPLSLPTKPPITDGKLDVQAVNIEENASKSPVNYVLPPGISRETDPGQPALLQLNEQAMVLKVTNLAPGDARGVYKNTAYDMRQYKRLQMFVHAEKFSDDNGTDKLQDDDLTCFIRLGSDLVNNYYEYEIPLHLTPGNILYSEESEADRAKVWLPENMFDFSFEALTRAKLERNKSKQSGNFQSDQIPYYDGKNNKIRVVGNPTISDIQNIMIGVRNNAGTTPKSGEIWVNELRMSQFDESGGWAAMGNVAVGLSDLGTINFSGRVETAGFGSIESNVTNRRMEDLYQMNFSTAMDLGRFLPEKAKLQIPAYFSYTNETLSPKYNPLDQDILLSDAMNNLTNQQDKDTLMIKTQTVNTSKSFNISGAKFNIKSKTPQFYDPANVAVTYAFTETNQHSAEIEQNMVKDERASLVYNFSFNPQPVEPFKKVKALEKPTFKLIKDFNFYYLPTSLSFNTNMNRQFSQVKLRDLNAIGGGAGNPLEATFSKDFMWNRQFDIKYDLTKAIKFSFQTAMNSRIDEPYYSPETGKETYENWRDSVWSNIKKLGNPYTYQQVFSASWNLPINKIPLFDWVTANASYNSSYNWNKMAQLKNSTENLGNIATSMGAWQADGQLNFENLYNKVKYLKDVNKRFSAQSGNKQKFQSKSYSEKVNLTKDKLTTINHRLGSERLKFLATDKAGKPITLNYKVKNATTIEITPAMDTDSILLTMNSLDPDVQSMGKTTIDMAFRTLMLVRRGSITYRQSNSMTLPGFKPTPGLLGQQMTPQGMNAPGYGFTFGIFNDSYLETASNNGWLYKSDSIVNPATTAFTSDLDIKLNLEPIPGFKIDLDAKRYEAKNTTIQYMFDGMPRTYNGSYNITLVALSTAFKPIGSANENYTSELFQKLLDNRDVVARRLNSRLTNTQYPTSGFLQQNNITGTYDATKGSFEKNSADVLIPAFLAAYTGRDASTVDTNPFLSLLSILPNWRISYDGLSNIAWVKENFKSISLTHAYTCRYSIGSYTSYSTWVAMGNGSDFGYVSDVQNENRATPSSPYNITDVSLNEQFSPLIGVNLAMKNSMTGKLEYRKQRNMALNLTSTQLIESTSDEYVVGLGYLLKDFDVILKLKSDQQTKVTNDLKLSADLSYKDIKTLLRKVEGSITQASSGNKLFTLKIIADYVFSSKVNIQLFYDRQASTPLISSSFPVSSSNFGVSFKFMLTR